MKQIGKWLLIFGVGSMALSAIGFEFRLLMWIDAWGPEVGWSIRIGMVVAGAILLFLGRRSADAPASTA